MSETLDGSATIVRDASASTRGRGLAALALLVAFGAAGASGWVFYRTQLAPSAASTAPAQDARVPALQDATQALAARAATLEQRTAELAQKNDALQAALEARARSGGMDQVLAEAEYLQRLANQSLLMGREVRGAIALLESADTLLREHDDPALHDVRTALANDLAQLRAVAAFDVEGTYLRLSALVAQIPTLAAVATELEAPRAAADAAQPANTPGWWARIRAVLDRYLVVRTHGEPVRPLLPANEEQNLRMNLRLALEQAKLALLAAEPVVYRGALGDADTWVQRYFGTRTAANRAFVDELRSLATLQIAPPLPDISDSLRALRSHKPQPPAPAAAAPAPAASAAPAAGGA